MCWLVDTAAMLLSRWYIVGAAWPAAGYVVCVWDADSDTTTDKAARAALRGDIRVCCGRVRSCYSLGGCYVALLANQAPPTSPRRAFMPCKHSLMFGRWVPSAHQLQFLCPPFHPSWRASPRVLRACKDILLISGNACAWGWCCRCTSYYY